MSLPKLIFTQKKYKNNPILVLFIVSANRCLVFFLAEMLLDFLSLPVLALVWGHSSSFD